MYDLASFVVRGQVRAAILFNLTVPRTPTQLAERVGTHRSTVSRALRELAEKKIVECITPDERQGRFYQLTEEGEKVRALLEEAEEDGS